MSIVFKSEKEVIVKKYEDLSAGDVFEYEGGLYVKCIGDCSEWYAISLNNEFYISEGMPPDAKVTCVNKDVHVTLKDKE